MQSENNSKKIKILFIIDFIDIMSGTESQLIKLINNLNKSEFEIQLLVLRNSEWLKKNQKKISGDIKVFNIKKLKNPINILSFIKIVNFIKKKKLHIVMTFFPLSNIIGVFAARLAGVKHIISTRRDYGLWLNWVTKWSIYPLRFANNFVTEIVANSYEVMNLTIFHEKINKSKCRCIYNGIDLENYSDNYQRNVNLKEYLMIPEKNMIIGLVAGLRPMKRHQIALYAAARIIKKIDNVNFIFVGDGTEREYLESLITKLGLSKHMHMVGWQEEIIPYLKIFDVGINCSANEGLSNAILEYMAFEVPCIVSKAGGNPELIKDGINGYLFELDNVDELTEKIINLLNDRNTQNKFKKNSKEIIFNKFSLEKMINNYENYFHNLISNC